MRTAVYRIVIFSLFLFDASCKKEVAGPQGEQGDTGAAGVPGPAGPPGKNGGVASTSNIIIDAAQWFAIPPDSLEWTATVALTIITAEIAQKGSVEVFLLENNQWQPLPYFDHTSFLTFSFETGKLTLVKKDSHGNSPPKPETETIRVTAIGPAGSVKKDNNDRSLQLIQTTVID